MSLYSSKEEALVAKAIKFYDKNSRSPRRSPTEVAAMLRTWAFETTGQVTETTLLNGIAYLRSALPAFMSHHDSIDLLKRALAL